MKIKRFLALTIALLMVGALAATQVRSTGGKVLVPDSSIEKPTDVGLRAHTNIQVFFPKEILQNEQTSGTIWPATSPNVVAAGGTTVRRSSSTGNFLSEAPWDSAGGGVSSLELRPSYQSGISSVVGKYRGVPDLSFDSNPVTGVWVYDSYAGGWNIVGGTSVASPALAGILNLAGSFYTSSNAELTAIYGKLGVAADLTDVTSGYCGPYAGYGAGAGWDFCTGVGSNKGFIGK